MKNFIEFLKILLLMYIETIIKFIIVVINIAYILYMIITIPFVFFMIMLLSILLKQMLFSIFVEYVKCIFDLELLYDLINKRYLIK